MIALAATATLLAALALPAAATDAPPQGDPADEACMAAAVSDTDYEDCAQAWAERADATLDRVYADARSGLASTDCDTQCGATLALLEAAQAQWTAWRRKDCDAIWQLNADGSIRNVEFLRCMALRANHRAAELRAGYGIAP